MPYAWYWHGEPLRTGLAQGEKIRPVCTGSHILQTTDHRAPDRPCCPANISDKQSCPCGHGHGHSSNTESHHWGPEAPQQNPNSWFREAQAQAQTPSCCNPSRPPVFCQDCARDTLRPEPCSLDRCCIAENTYLPGDPCCQTPQDTPYPASRCNYCTHPKSEMHCGDSPRMRSHPHSAPVKCQQSFTRFESCDRFDCCEDTFFSKCEYSTEESMETGNSHGHGQDTDFETRSYHRRRPWVNHQLNRKY
jgi:hypothetical protein